MRAIPCLLLNALLLNGCFLHDRPADSTADAGFDSAPPTPDSGPVDDSGPIGPADMGPDDSCRPAIASLMCPRPYFGDSPQAFSLQTEDCHCEGTLRCQVDVLREAEAGRLGVLRARLDVCNESACLACTGPNVTECELPSLAEGDYQVQSGSGEFVLRGVGSLAPSDPIFNECQTPGPSGGLCEAIGNTYEPDEICLTPGRPTVVRGGSDCIFDPGPCSMTLTTSRLESAIRVSPRERECDESGPVWDCETWECPPAPSDGPPRSVRNRDDFEVGTFDPAGGEQCFELFVGG